MKPLKISCLLFLSFFYLGQISTQNLISSSSFDSGLNGWIANGGWEWSEDGKADAADGLWNDRSAIQSQSGPGAAVYKSTTPSFGTLTSPIINLGIQQTAFLKFNQYYRNFESITQLRISNTNNGLSLSITLNPNVLRHVETSASDVQTIDISPLVSEGDDNTEIQISFSFEGNRYFWLIDDIQFWDDFPPPVATNPTLHGDSLSFYDYPYRVHTPENAGTDGSIAWPYVPNQIVVQFSPLATEVERQAIRDTLGAIKIDSCVCDVLELWRMSDNIIVDQDGNPIPDGGSIGILERVLGSSTNSKIDGVDLNYYTATQYGDEPSPPITTINPTDIINIPTAPQDAIRIAVLDTGVDYLHESGELDGLNGFIYQKEDTDCYDNDPIGWNFVNGLNNPMDDHSHGTHVAGIIANNIRDNGPHDCDFHIIPIKTHDSHGVSTLFQVSCGTYQAIEEEVSVVNDSWGFYGTASIILENAISAALDENILIVSAAGNDSLWLDSLNQYPACYNADNRLTVGSVEEDLSISAFSNFSSFWVNILAPGREIISTVPPFIVDTDISTPAGYAKKTGTSMSTPAVTAAAAIAYCSYPDYNHVKNRVLDCADGVSALTTFAVDGKVLRFDVDCLTTATEDLPISSESAFSIFPNPTNGQLTLVPKTSLEKITLSVLGIEGKEIMRQQIAQWYEGQEENLNLATLPAGMYFLHIQQADTSWVSKIVKLGSL